MYWHGSGSERLPCQQPYDPRAISSRIQNGQRSCFWPMATDRQRAALLVVMSSIASPSSRADCHHNSHAGLCQPDHRIDTLIPAGGVHDGLTFREPGATTSTALKFLVLIGLCRYRLPYGIDYPPGSASPTGRTYFCRPLANVNFVNRWFSPREPRRRISSRFRAMPMTPPKIREARMPGILTSVDPVDTSRPR